MPRHPQPETLPSSRGFRPRRAQGSRNGNYTEGDWTAEALEERRWVRELVRFFANPG
jgi:hypothetical protein